MWRSYQFQITKISIYFKCSWNTKLHMHYTDDMLEWKVFLVAYLLMLIEIVRFLTSLTPTSNVAVRWYFCLSVEGGRVLSIAPCTVRGLDLFRLDLTVQGPPDILTVYPLLSWIGVDILLKYPLVTSNFPLCSSKALSSELNLKIRKRAASWHDLGE